MVRPLVNVVAIVKDEANNFEKTLRSTMGKVDAWTILDTGSTDGTQDIVRIVCNEPRLLEAVGMAAPREGIIALHEEPFVDFATSRNRVIALDAARPDQERPEFSLMISGDEVLVETRAGALREFLESKREAPEGAYSVQMATGTQSWSYPRVTRHGGGWKYVGKVHEIPVAPDGKTIAPIIPDVHIVHAPTDPERRAARIRNFDFPTLTEMVADESKTLDERAQAIFFLAESHNVLAAACDRDQPGGEWLSHQMAAMALYLRYSQIAEDQSRPGYDPEKARFALFRWLNTAENAGIYTNAELITRIEGLISAAPMLPELRYMLAVHEAQLDHRRGLFRAQESANIARQVRLKPVSFLPTDSRIEWLSLRLAAECAFAAKNNKQAKELAMRAVEAGAPPEALERILGTGGGAAAGAKG